MLNINLVYLGNERELFYKQAADEYIKRISPFCSFTQKNIKDEKLQNNPSFSEIKNALEKEGEKILNSIPPRHYKIALCVEGTQVSSEKFSNLLSSVPGMGFSGISFIIGSSYGICDKVKSLCDFKLSMSNMTFPHKLAKVMLLEQIYRAFEINKGSKYHK